MKIGGTTRVNKRIAVQSACICRAAHCINELLLSPAQNVYVLHLLCNSTERPHVRLERAHVLQKWRREELTYVELDVYGFAGTCKVFASAERKVSRGA